MTDGGVGGNVGDSSSRFYYFEERGNPDGFIAIAIAPSAPMSSSSRRKSFVDLLALDDGRTTGRRPAHRPERAAQLRRSARLWREWRLELDRLSSSAHSVRPNFWTESVPPVWMHVSAPIRQDMWRRCMTAAGRPLCPSPSASRSVRPSVVNGGMSASTTCRSSTAATYHR
ncbi:MAG: hypothetical protein R2724_09490 [Bryobacterales bacterium]